MAKPDRVETVSPGDLVVIFRQMDAGYRAAPASALAQALVPMLDESVHGADGAPGINGTDGVGVPVGGTTGQVLTKASASDYDTTWTDQTGAGANSYFPGGW